MATKLEARPLKKISCGFPYLLKIIFADFSRLNGCLRFSWKLKLRIDQVI